jgi:L-arabinose isomerase
MNAPSSQLRIGYLPFYVDYYEGICADFPREKAANAKRCAEALAQHGEVVWNGELIRNVESAAAVGKKLAHENLDCVVVFTSIAIFGAIPWAALQHLSVPILIWNAQQIRTVGKGYTMVEIVRNTGQIGTQALANTLVREGRWFHVVTGYEKSKRTAEDLKRFCSIIRVVNAVKKARLLAIGQFFPAMTDILIDEAAFKQHIGATVMHVSNEELTKRYQETLGVPPLGGKNRKPPKGGTPNALVDEVRELTDDESLRSSRLCATLQSLVEEHCADGGTLNCHVGVCLRNPVIGITACYSLGVQNSLGRPFTCTGDLPTAIAMLMLKKLTGISMYTEVQVMDEKRKTIVIANSGEGEDGIRRKDSKSIVRGNTNFTGVHGRGASFAYSLQPGAATIISFTPSPKSTRPFRLIVAEGEILRESLPDAGALAGFFRFKNADLHTGYTRWLEAGAVHHAATTLGHWSRELKAVAELLNIDFIEI